MGALVVLQSLVPNAREIFKILALHQVEQEDGSGLHSDSRYLPCQNAICLSVNLHEIVEAQPRLLQQDSETHKPSHTSYMCQELLPVECWLAIDVLQQDQGCG